MDQQKMLKVNKELHNLRSLIDSVDISVNDSVGLGKVIIIKGKEYLSKQQIFDILKVVQKNKTEMSYEDGIEINIW